MARERGRRRIGAVLALALIVGGGAVALAGGLVAAVSGSVDETPAAVAEARERDDVTIRRCRRTLVGLEAVVVVANDTTAASTYYLGVQFRDRRTDEALTAGTGVADAVPPGERRREVITVAADGRRPIDCELLEVRRLAS